jgi:hypothetical protein
MSSSICAAKSMEFPREEIRRLEEACCGAGKRRSIDHVSHARRMRLTRDASDCDPWSSEPWSKRTKDHRTPAV